MFVFLFSFVFVFFQVRPFIPRCMEGCWLGDQLLLLT